MAVRDVGVMQRRSAFGGRKLESCAVYFERYRVESSYGSFTLGYVFRFFLMVAALPNPIKKRQQLIYQIMLLQMY